MRTCLFGGTFDPPHIGHLLVAQTVCEAENFDKVLFIPAYQPPHKDDITPVDERLKMLELAVEGNPNFEISDVELKRKGVSYTIDTVKFIKEEMRLKSQELFYLMGRLLME